MSQNIVHLIMGCNAMKCETEWRWRQNVQQNCYWYLSGNQYSITHTT